jgi:hypothetical protein
MLQLLIEQRNYSHIQTYIYKAESAIEAATMTASKERDKDGNNGGNSKKTGASADRDRVQTMLDFAAGMSQLGQGNYEKAASAFVRLGPPKQLGDWIGKVRARTCGWRFRFSAELTKSSCLLEILPSMELFVHSQAFREVRSSPLC